MNAEGDKAISVIGFIGSVFSPWYAWSADRIPQNHCCLNVATYGQGGRFTMTDRGQSALRQTRDRLTIGPSSLRWTGAELIIEIDEISAPPVVGRVRGRVILRPAAITTVALPLTPEGTHVWRPFAPVASIEVDLEAPGWQWQGHGYFDANFGSRPLGKDFSYWTWARYPTPDGQALCFYDATRRDGSTLNAALNFGPDGRAVPFSAPPRAAMKPSVWRVRRDTPADPGTQPVQVQQMLEAPFYCRAGVRTVINGQTLTGIHEALDLTRFSSRLIKPMLALRVPRRARWTFAQS